VYFPFQIYCHIQGQLSMVLIINHHPVSLTSILVWLSHLLLGLLKYIFPDQTKVCDVFLISVVCATCLAHSNIWWKIQKSNFIIRQHFFCLLLLHPLGPTILRCNVFSNTLILWEFYGFRSGTADVSVLLDVAPRLWLRDVQRCGTTY